MWIECGFDSKVAIDYRVTNCGWVWCDFSLGLLLVVRPIRALLMQSGPQSNLEQIPVFRFAQNISNQVLIVNIFYLSSWHSFLQVEGTYHFDWIAVVILQLLKFTVNDWFLIIYMLRWFFLSCGWTQVWSLQVSCCIIWHFHAYLLFRFANMEVFNFFEFTKEREIFY